MCAIGKGGGAQDLTKLVECVVVAAFVRILATTTSSTPPVIFVFAKHEHNKNMKCKALLKEVEPSLIALQVIGLLFFSLHWLVATTMGDNKPGY